MTLVAIRTVSHAGVLYRPGERLPAGVDEARLLRLNAAARVEVKAEATRPRARKPKAV